MKLTNETIVPRNISFGISKNPKRHWSDGDLLKTAMIDCLSIFLPEGERFFIRSLKHYLPQLKDEKLRKEIQGYSIQEAFHTREHEDYNAALRALGYDVDAMEAAVRKRLGRNHPPIFNLALTCSIEHLTMSISMVTLANPDILRSAPDSYRQIWTWHAVEELEHCGVALHIFNEMTADWSALKRYALRISCHNAVIFQMLRMQLHNVALYARNDGQKTNVKFWLKLLWVFFVNPGIVGKTLPHILRYYRPAYRPQAKTYAHLLNWGRAFIGREIPELAEDSTQMANELRPANEGAGAA